VRTRRAARVMGPAVAAAWLMLACSALAANAAPAAGPPYPEPVTGQRVYDNAGIFSPQAIASAEQVIRAIEDRTGAQVAVYTQVKPQSDDLDKANADALALMNQWGVGRKGFDDGLVIMFDMQTNLAHGQCSLYAGSGFRAVFLTDADRQSIFDNDMLPRLKEQDFDGALAIALRDIDAAATPQHAAQLNLARQINAVVGIGFLALAIWLVAFVIIRWYQHGRDPIYVDDSSVLMPAPPAGLTPAMATLVMDDRTSRQTVSAGLVDLAARGLVQFRQQSHLLSRKTELGATSRREAIYTPEAGLLGAIQTWSGPDGYIGQSSMHELAPAVKSFKSDLETLAVSRRWLTGKPSSVILRWIVVGIVEFAVAASLFWWTFRLDASGGFLGGGAMAAAGLVTIAMSQIMPSRTPTGSMIRAWLAAYKRTLAATMAMSTSMDEVVRRRPVPWIDTPDQAMAWGVALGLNDEIDGVLHRTMDETRRTGTPAGWYPAWWSTSGHGFAGGGGSGGSVVVGGTAGLYSASAIPDVGSMVSAIGSIGSTSSGGGGGFGGGGGGGGGGAGGGF
jgi:uncharacterized membrane protein YgcG